jgi:phosphoribosylformimino-5-aminoimidazole carboxamide ribonucleotide (ProFAR) isomerase
MIFPCIDLMDGKVVQLVSGAGPRPAQLGTSARQVGDLPHIPVRLVA